MVEEAARCKAEDDAAREGVEARNALEAYAYSVRGALAEQKAQEALSAEEREAAQGAVGEAMAWLEHAAGASKAECDARREALEKACAPVLAKLHQGAGQGAPMDAGAHTSAPVV